MKTKIVSQLGSASCAVIIGGVIVSVLMSQLATTYNESVDSEIIFHEAIWIFGLLYIISGIVGLVAAFIQNRCMYMTTCFVVCISGLTLFLCVIFADLHLLTLVFSYWRTSDYCEDTGDNCACNFKKKWTTNEYTPTPFKTCAYLENFYSAVKVFLTFVLLTHLAQVAEFAVAAYYYLPSQKPTADVAIIPSEEPALEPGHYMMPQAYAQPGLYMMPQAYVQPGSYMMLQPYGQPGPNMMPQAYGQPGPNMMPQTYSQPGPYMMPQAYGQGYQLQGNI